MTNHVERSYLSILKALQYRQSNEKQTFDRAIPDSTGANEPIKEYFNAAHSPDRLFGENFPQAMQLLISLVERFGTDGMYSFFSALSDQEVEYTRNDKENFNTITRQVIAPPFIPPSPAEKFQQAALFLHLATALTAGRPIAFCSTLISGKNYISLRNERLRGLKPPSIETMRNALPLFNKMHDIAQHAIDILNEVEKAEYPDLPSLDVRFLENALNSAQAAIEQKSKESKGR